MLSLGIVLFEIPSNMILYRVGPGKWLTLQLFLFGIVSTFQAFQRGYGPFIATRFLLGITESGFIPGGLWTLSTWYTRKETAKRVMIFYFGNQFGQASAKLLAYGILHMRNVGGQPGWFWLFAIMGAFTVFCGFILGFFLPDSFRNPRSTFLPRVTFFTDRELHILKNRVILDDPMKGKKKKSIGLGAFRQAVSCHQSHSHVSCLLLLLTFHPLSSSQIGVYGYIFLLHYATMVLNVLSIHTHHRSSIASASPLSQVMQWPQLVSFSKSQYHSHSVMFRTICKSDPNTTWCNCT